MALPKPISTPSHEAKESPSLERKEHKYHVELSRKSGRPLPHKTYEQRLKAAKRRTHR